MSDHSIEYYIDKSLLITTALVGLGIGMLVLIYPNNFSNPVDYLILSFVMMGYARQS